MPDSTSFRLPDCVAFSLQGAPCKENVPSQPTGKRHSQTCPIDDSRIIQYYNIRSRDKIVDTLSKNHNKNWHFNKKQKITNPLLDENLAAKFPLTAYFQSHFQFIHENNHDCKTEIKHLKNKLASIEEKIESLLVLPNKLDS
jgi:hypothetical protein